jgi:osmoprotectant transport system permease protein
LPLAAPVIVAGVRTATVWVVGTATLSTPVGATSLGNYIFSGLQTRNFNAVLVGCVAAAGLALGLDSLIRLLERGVATRRRSLISISLTVLAALYLYAGVTLAAGGAAGDRRERLRIGAKTFTEQYILSELLARQIERRAGIECRAVSSLGSTVAFDALRAGEIDLYVEYTGTIWATLMDREGEAPGREAMIERVTAFLDDQHGVELLAALGFENAYALAVRDDRAEALGVHTLSDLARVSAELEIGGDYEFFERSEWRSLESVYGLAFRARRSMDPSLMYRAVADGQVDVISAFSSDGRIAAFDLRVIEDDRGAIPPYDAVVLARAGFVRQFPAAAAAVRELAGRIDAATMRRLNLEVDRDRRTPAAVAAAFLEDHLE